MRKLVIGLALLSGCAQEWSIIQDEPNPTPTPQDIPVAVCSASEETVDPPLTEVTLFGEESYDPQGLEIIEYRWELISAPDGTSLPSLTADTPNIGGFQPDVAGDFVAQLVVVNEVQRESEPCQVTISAVPIENLHVELYWESAGDDMDLHLIREGGRVDSSDDCYFANCSSARSLRMNWGDPSETMDDPALDLDDIPGVGPENIVIKEPGEAFYTVVVHDHTSRSYAPSNLVTVNIFMNGERVFEETRAISGENKQVAIAEINWARKTVTPLSQ